MARSAMDNAKKLKIYSLFNEGVPTASIADRFCLSRNYVADLVRKMKLARKLARTELAPKKLNAPK